MRLIDADTLKENFFDYAPFEMMWDRGDIRHKIDEMPTVDAIPVEWLKKLFEDDGDWNEEKDVIDWAICRWQQEQEAKS